MGKKSIEYWKTKYNTWVVRWSFVNKNNRHQLGVTAFRTKALAKDFINDLKDAKK